MGTRSRSTCAALPHASALLALRSATTSAVALYDSLQPGEALNPPTVGTGMRAPNVAGGAPRKRSSLGHQGRISHTKGGGRGRGWGHTAGG